MIWQRWLLRQKNRNRRRKQKCQTYTSVWSWTVRAVSIIAQSAIISSEVRLENTVRINPEPLLGSCFKAMYHCYPYAGRHDKKRHCAICIQTPEHVCSVGHPTHSVAPHSHHIQHMNVKWPSAGFPFSSFIYNIIVNVRKSRRVDHVIPRFSLNW